MSSADAAVSCSRLLDRVSMEIAVCPSYWRESKKKKKKKKKRRRKKMMQKWKKKREEAKKKNGSVELYRLLLEIED